MILDLVRAHYIRLWGMPSWTNSLWNDTFQLEVLKWEASTHPEEVTMYATLGASQFPPAGHSEQHRFEFFSGLLPEQDGMAKVLADVAYIAVSGDAPIGSGHTISYQEPLWPGTRMSSVLLETALDDMVPKIAEPGSGVHVTFLQVTPLYSSEVQFIKDHSLMALNHLWQSKKVPYWDPNRAAEPS